MAPTPDRPLFGGALAAPIPMRFADASAFRQVPDNQEVFADPLRDESVIVELLELSEDVSDEEAVTFHFTELADHNEAMEREVMTVVKLDTTKLHGMRPDATAHILNGIQKVSKFNEHGQGALNTVAITLVCLRIPSASTDLLLSHNRSVDIGPQSSSAGLASGGGASEAGSIDDNFLRGIYEGFKIFDWALFP